MPQTYYEVAAELDTSKGALRLVSRPTAEQRLEDASEAQAIRSVGARLFFLPPYSPDLNPIEMMFAKLKTLLRKADERSIEATWRRVGSLLDTFSSEECSAYLRHAGYASTKI